MAHNFWMIITNPNNFRITQELGFTKQGLKSQHRRKIQRIENGDRVLFYVSHDRCFTATATATSSYFEESEEVWEKEGSAEWPYQIKIKPEIVLDQFQYIDANILAPRLDYIKRWPPENWYMAFQGNLHLLPKSDFLLIEEEMKKLKFGKNHKRGTLAPPQDAPRRRRKRGPARSAPGEPGVNREPNQSNATPGQPRVNREPNQSNATPGEPGVNREPNQSNATPGEPRVNSGPNESGSAPAS